MNCSIKMSSSPDHSYNRLDGVESFTTSLDTASFNRPFPISNRGSKYSSTYVPHNRLSRYATAFTNLAPVRFKSTSGSELPLDKIGLFSSISFSWLNEYLSTSCKNGIKDTTLPTAAEQDSCQINGSRLDGLWHAHVVERGQSGASIPRIVWKFTRTRVLVASFIYTLGMLISLLSPIFLMHGIISSIEHRNTMYNSTLNATSTTAANNTLIAVKSGSLSNQIRVTANASLATMSPLITNATNGTSSKSIKTSIGKEIIQKLPDSIKHLIVVDEVIIFTDVLILVLVEILSYVLIAWSSALNLRTASRLRSACLALVYKKLIRSSVRQGASAYQTITFFVPDTETLYELITHGPLIFTGPFVMILSSVIIYYLMGSWALVGIAVLVTFYLCLVLTAYLTSVFATKTVEYSFKRMTLVEEFFSNIYLAKVTLWDICFRNQIEDMRKKELMEMRLGGLSEGWSLCMVHFIPVVTVCATTIASVLTFKEVHQSEYMLILVISLVNLKHCVRNSWLAMSSISRGITALNKLKAVLTMTEADRYPDKPIDKNLAITINRGNFKWINDKNSVHNTAKRLSQFYIENHEGVPVRFDILPCTDTLTDINFFAPKGKMIGICGRPGSGKTSLLLALMGHLRHISGQVTRDGTLAYVPENPWLLEGTLKENILFGEIFDSNRYYMAIHACLLNTDMTLLPAMDDTDVTQINLTDGQKQRIALARAVYASRDINLLDNPLANVQVNESTQIFEKCFMEVMRKKTIIIVSEKIHFLNRCDTIYVLRDGRIVEQGNHDELIQWDSEYIQLVRSYMKKYERMSYRDGESCSPTAAQLLLPGAPRGILTSSSTDTSLHSILDDVQQEDTALLKFDLNSEFPMKLNDKNKPIVEYGMYVKNAGGCCVAFIACLLSVACAFFIASAPLSFIYIAQKTIANNAQIVIMFATMVGSIVLFGLILMIIYNKAVFHAASKFHDAWIDGINAAQMSLFTTTPTAVLLNICSLNLYEVDAALPRSIITILIHVGISIFSVVILVFVSCWLLIPITLFIFAAVAYSIYVRSAVISLYGVKVNSIVPIYNHAVNTIEGRTVIQAHRREKDFTKKFYRFCDYNSTYNFMLHAIQLWMEYRIKLLAALTVGAVIIICVSLNVIRDRFEPMVLAFICTLQLVASIVTITEASAKAYTSFMAITGLNNFFENISKEKVENYSLSFNWPTDGSFKFDNVTLALNPMINSDLSAVNFEVAPGQKIALIGSSASSKLAIVSALYKFVDVASGHIYVSNTDINDVPPDKLRQCITFVPGDPLLFNGSIKYNLDPTGNVSDKEAMTALQRVFLWEKVSKLPDKLETDVRNCFTMGERKLMFFARILLRKSVKIIIIEESMTDIGNDMEKLVEIVLRDVFSEYTILVLSTQRVRYCHRTLVLSNDTINEAPQRKLSLSQHSIAMSEVLSTATMNNIFETRF